MDPPTTTTDDAIPASLVPASLKPSKSPPHEDSIESLDSSRPPAPAASADPVQHEAPSLPAVPKEPEITLEVVPQPEGLSRDVSTLSHNPSVRNADDHTYSNRESEGLEVFAPYSTSPEVVFPSYSDQPTLDRNSLVPPGHYRNSVAPAYSAQDYSGDNYADKKSRFSASGYQVPPEQSDHSDSAIQNNFLEKQSSPATPPKRRYLGMSLQMLLGVIALVLVVLIALGVGLGVGLKPKSSQPAPTTRENATQLNQTFYLSNGFGLATAMFDDVQLVYYQDDSLNVIEERYVSTNWTFQNPNNPNGSITGLVPGTGSTIVALSYAQGGLAWRSLFFIDAAGNVCTSNTTSKLEETTVWTPASRLSVTPAYTGSTAGLAACVDTSPRGWNGIMLYYGDTQNIIRALTFDFASPSKGWIEKTGAYGFSQADTASGLGCTFGTISNLPYVNLYTRILSSGFFRRFSTLKSATGTKDSDIVNFNITVPQTTPITVTSDGNADYAFYPSGPNQIAKHVVSVNNGLVSTSSRNISLDISDVSKVTSVWRGSQGDGVSLLFTNGTYNNTDGTGVDLWEVGVPRNNDFDYNYYETVQTRKRWLDTVVRRVTTLF